MLQFTGNGKGACCAGIFSLEGVDDLARLSSGVFVMSR